MRVKQIWTGNAYRNFNYLIACPESGEALAVDPLDVDKCQHAAKEEGWEITQIVNTHEHHDHIGGNTKLVEQTGAKILAHEKAGSKIPGVSRGLAAGDVIKVGKTVELEVLDTPGHTMCHVCLLAHGEQAALFAGDTMFNAGAGNCHNGGHPDELYNTFTEQLGRLGSETRLYPGHDYIENNLKFTLDREPDNQAAKQLLEQIDGQDPGAALTTTLAMEREVNTFFRLASPSVIAALQQKFPEIGDNPDPRTVFLKLRELRNDW